MATPEEKGDGWKELGRRVIYSVNPFDYEQEGFEVAARFMSNPDDFSDEQIAGMVERVYPGALKRGDVKPWKEGDYAKGRRPPGRVAERMDMLRLAVGDPQRYGTMKESVFTPTRGAEEGEKFYTFQDRNQIKDVYNMLKKHIPKMEKEKGKSFNVGYKSDVRKGDADFSGSGAHVGMERFQVSIGEDDIGKYMAIYDSWDIDYDVPIVGKIAKKAIPGFQIYDRVYYEAKAPESDLKIRKGEQQWPPEAKYASPRKQGIEDKVMDLLQRVF